MVSPQSESVAGRFEFEKDSKYWHIRAVRPARLSLALENKASGDEPIAALTELKGDRSANKLSKKGLPETPIELRRPRPEDGPAVTELIRNSPPLDVNSAYCNLLQCTQFADTCVVADLHGEVVGWLSAHRPPSAPEQIFVWQVAVDARLRGVGLAQRMLDELLTRPAARGAQALTSTITQDNAASWALFSALARRLGCRLQKSPLFLSDEHFAGAHDTEWQAVIGPLPPASK